MSLIPTEELAKKFKVSIGFAYRILVQYKVPNVRENQFYQWDKKEGSRVLKEQIAFRLRPEPHCDWLNGPELIAIYGKKLYLKSKRIIEIYNLKVRDISSDTRRFYYYLPDFDIATNSNPNKLYKLTKIQDLMRLTLDELLERIDKWKIKIKDDSIYSKDLYILFVNQERKKYKPRVKKTEVIPQRKLGKIITLHGKVHNNVDKNFIFISKNHNYDCKFQLGVSSDDKTINDIVSITGGYGAFAQNRNGLLKIFYVTSFKLKGEK